VELQTASKWAWVMGVLEASFEADGRGWRRARDSNVKNNGEDREEVVFEDRLKDVNTTSAGRKEAYVRG
jgi:hypothetical protein